MIIMGAGICQWFHGDATYRAVLALLLLTGSMGRNGGGWAHYVGQEKCRPVTGWATMAMATDWSRPPRQMPGTSYWYAHTDQWRYDGYRADALASPLGRGRFRDKHTMDVLASAVAMGWRPFFPQFDRSSLDIADEARAAGQEIPAYVAEQLASGELKLAVTDPDNPANWPRVLTSGGRTCSARRARATSTSCSTCSAPLRTCRRNPPRSVAAQRCRLDRRHPGGQARPADVDRLPDDLDDPAVGCGAARGDLVREGRPVQHRHAPLRPRVQPGHRPAVGDPVGLRRVRRDRPGVQRAGRQAPGHPHRRGAGCAAARHAGGDGVSRWHRA